MLGGLLSRHCYVSKLYSDYLSQNELFSATLRGNDSTADGWLLTIHCDRKLLPGKEHGWKLAFELAFEVMEKSVTCKPTHKNSYKV